MARGTRGGTTSSAAGRLGGLASHQRRPGDDRTVQPPEPIGSRPGISTFTAATALPAPLLEGATARLQSVLRGKLAAAGLEGLSDWRDVTVTGPEESTDAYGRSWFWYRGTLQVTTPPLRETVHPMTLEQPAVPDHPEVLASSDIDDRSHPASAAA